jgi:hypothetical protein
MSLELLGLGLDFMGGLLGSKSQARQNRLQMQQAQKQFDIQMNQSVQRRVKDAKAAGVHPLFALGASVGASPTISAQGETRGNPMQSALTNMASKLGVIEGNRAKARLDEAQAALFDSQRARIEQELNSRGQDAAAVKPEAPAVAPPVGYVDPVQLGYPEGTKRIPDRVPVVDTAGNEYDLPNPELGLDEVGQIEYVLGVPDRAVKAMKKNAYTKYEIMQLERELAWLRDRRLHGGKDYGKRMSSKYWQKARSIYKRYAALRRKAQNWWKQYSSQPSPIRRNLDKHPIYRGVGK